jgi:phospholipid/cholesterol/gamma-HCH transport system substrate-binding protein
MKLNNETKIGLMAVLGIGILIIGFNFLKGKGLFTQENKIYAVYQDVQGLVKSNPVKINGLQVGRISDINGGRDLRKIVVTVSLNKEVDIPDNSLAVINPNLLGSPTMEIQLGTSHTYLKNGDTVLTSLSGGALDEAMKLINPVLYEVRNAVRSLDSVLTTITGVFDTRAKNNIKNILQNLDATTASFVVTSASLKKLMDSQNGAMSQSIENINKFTSNLNANNGRIDSIMENTKVFTQTLSKMDLKKMLDTLNVAISNFKTSAEKINSKEGSIGLLLNDKTLYNNLEATTNKINTLLDDIRVHPKRYVNFSVFGKKDKGNYLKEPLANDTQKVDNQ